jgi:predicted amidohydrolase
VNTTVVACCQVAPALGDPAANRELTAGAVSHGAAQGASVVVLPDLVSSGYVFQSQAEATASAEPADGQMVTLWARLAAHHSIVIVGGFGEAAAAGELFNSAALVDPGGCAASTARRTCGTRSGSGSPPAARPLPWYPPGSAGSR